VKSLLSGEKILKLQRECQGNVFLFARTIEVEVARAFAETSPTAGQLHDHANAVEAGLE
jgi:hypothetical protein